MCRDQPLLSADGRVSLLVQSDGNLVLYNTQVAGRVGLSFASAIYFTATYGASPQPFSLANDPGTRRSSQAPTCRHFTSTVGPSLPCMLLRRAAQRCCSTGSNQTIFTFGTSNQGAAPCRLVVSGAGGGGFAIIDANNAVQDFQGAYSPAGTQQGNAAGRLRPQAGATGTPTSLASWLATLLMQEDDRVCCHAECQAVLGGHHRLPHPPVGRQPGDL